MAYVSKELKNVVAGKLKDICNKYKIKATLKVVDNRCLRCTIRSGDIDFSVDYMQVNAYYIDKNFSNKARECLNAIKNALNTDNFDNSDVTRDNFDVGHYIAIFIGEYDKPYVLNTQT